MFSDLDGNGSSHTVRTYVQPCLKKCTLCKFNCKYYYDDYKITPIVHSTIMKLFATLKQLLRNCLQLWSITLKLFLSVCLKRQLRDKKLLILTWNCRSQLIAEKPSTYWFFNIQKKLNIQIKHRYRKIKFN